jgi:dCTP deaminase
MILHDAEIRRLCEENALVHPYDESLVNPASIDLRLSDELLVEQRHTKAMRKISIAGYTAKHPYDLAPKQFVLAATLEVFKMPPTICGVFVLKSSRAREGYEHAHAGFADCGWTGSRLTLELVNNRQYHTIPLYPGLLIGQMVFLPMECAPTLDYGVVGHYNNQPHVMPSWLCLPLSA